MTENESKIINSLKKGDIKTFEEIYANYRTNLINFANLYINDKFTSEEIVNDLFTDLWVKRQKLNITTSLSAYLYQSVKNRAISKLRSAKTQIIEQLKEDFELTANCSPEKNIIHKEEQNHIDSLLELIPPRSREIFIMHKYDKLKYKEIAEILDISVNTVENHIVKAMKILRDYYLQNKL